MFPLKKLISLERRAVSIGFDWPNTDAIIDQAVSECDEIRQSARLEEGPARLQEEIGDLLHACLSLCIYNNIDIEQAILQTTNKFQGRLVALEKIMIQRGFQSLEGQPFDVLLDLWHEAKKQAQFDSYELELTIRPLEINDISEIVNSFTNCGWMKPASLFEGYIQDQLQGKRLCWVAFNKSVFMGYVTLKWQSLYDPFRERSIPEINDLNVIPSFQKQGIGSRLLRVAEEAAFEWGNKVGIGVGLSNDYGQAQKLYINRGYVPDGLGVTYNYQHIKPSEKVSIDDNLILWLTKEIG